MQSESVLKEISHSVVQFLSPQSLAFTYRRIVLEMAKLYGATDGSIYIIENGKIACPFSTIEKSQRIYPRKKGYIYKSFKTGRARIVSKEQFLKIHPDAYLDNQVNAIALIALTYFKKPIGVLSLQFSDTTEEVEKKLAGIILFASIASLAIRKNQLFLQSQDALKTRNLFISLAAHELRTPLTTGNILVDRIKQRIQKKVVPPMQWAITLKKEMDRMTRLVNELLQIDQIDQGRFVYEFETLNMHKILDEVALFFKINHPERVLELKLYLVANDLNIIADHNKLLQVFTNIIHNSIKFSPSDSPIRIAARTEKNRIKVSFTDYGPGISKKDMPFVFRGFFKSNPETKEGMGLGLYVSKRIVQAHKGTIQAKSRLGKWTKIIISLPKA